MAKVIITLEDTDEGSVTVNMQFDPVLKSEEEGTPAQYAAAQMLNTLQKTARGVDDDGDDE